MNEVRGFTIYEKETGRGLAMRSAGLGHIREGGREVNTVACYQCGDEVLDRDSVNADHITKDGGSFCHKCYEEVGE